MSSQPSSPINFTTAPAPKTPSSSTTANSNARRVLFSTKSTTSNNNVDILSPSSSATSPFTPFSARSGSLSRLSSAFNTPLQLDDSPTATTTSSKRAAAGGNKADFSDNWRTKPSPSAGENVTAAATSPSFLRSPAFVSNDRRLPRGLAVSQASPSSSAALASPKHRMSATTTTTAAALASPIKYFSGPNSATNTSPTASRRRRVPLFDRSNLEALTAIADVDASPVGTTMLLDREDDALEDDAARATAAAANVHGHLIHSHLNSSSDSDFFIRMDAAVQPRALCRDYLTTNENNSSLSSYLRNDVSLINAENEKRMMEVEVDANYCSGCGSSSNGTARASSSITLSYLQPCQHAICHQCFTGMLNIVGEKGLECPMCKGQVTSFDVQGDYHHHHHHPSSSPTRAAHAYHSSEKNSIATTTAGGATTTKLKTTTGQQILPATSFASAKTKMKAAASGLATADDVFSSTFTPSSLAAVVGDASSTAPSTTTSDFPVLRIDNLPWDVTPQMLTTWLHPTTPFRTHILLERSTGKTHSHCFVELRTLQDARTVLRECQNKIIGTGKRTRAVSVTVSRQEEVMQNIFPNWRASFTSTSPSLEGLDGRQTSEVLKAGLLSYNELESILQLMHNPESHFLKVPTLPFYAIVSILQKFPGSGDESSGLFWSCALRDRVFAAVQILSVRVSQQDWDPKLLDEVVVAAVECQAFTEMQRRLISITANLDSSYPASSSADSSPADGSSSDSVATPPPSQQLYVNDLEVPPPAASSLQGGSPWYSRVVNNAHFSAGSTQPPTASNTDIKGSPRSSSLRMGNLDSPPMTTSPATYVGGPSHNASSSTTHRRQHPHRQHRTTAPIILAPPSPTTTAGPSSANNNPRTLFEEIGDDVGVDAELVKMVVKRLFISQQ